MSLHDELGFSRRIRLPAHALLLEVVVTAGLLFKELERVVRSRGLTAAQFDILMLLAYQGEGGVLDQTRLGRMLVVNRSNVTGLVDRMEAARLVERLPDPSDRRVRRVRVTAAGRRALGAAERPYLRRVEEVVARLSAGDREGLSRLLETLRAGIRPKR
jgi:DNA-binding MarR family transcriptional regulator